MSADYNFCNEVKEGVSAIRRFDWSRENIRHSDVILVSHWLVWLAGSYVSYNR